MSKKASLSLVHPGRTAPEPSRPLEDAGLRLWRAVHEQYSIVDAGGLETLLVACQALDRAERCRKLIDEHGELVISRGGMRSNPLLRDELQNRALCLRAIARLGLDLEPIGPIGRPGGK